jgi:hypothetical protein
MFLLASDSQWRDYFKTNEREDLKKGKEKEFILLSQFYK